ncbi:trigger factor [Hyphomicrobium denitrificans 1NES1]|uniref:Trigger factor n=1 Tax=Hyphomicrobium denitrificans 1NES1 TaxID=670307 RepID=N0BA62_9HYPH|nr:trigger factor [Hyphomicrobium denitrificans]AGK57426.1 trigger factor [Hyphomicrobium denitrificans 1NES1]
MQVTETARDGLKRTLQVVVGKAELGERFSERLDELKDRVQIKGFRRGKVPLAHLKKLYGKSLMQEVLEQTINDTSAKAVKDRNERPAQQPKLELLGIDDGGIERVVNGETDLSYKMDFEVLPPIPLADLGILRLEQLVADVDDAAIDKALADLAERNTSYEPEEGRVAGEGDLVTMNFAGRIDGEAFEGGSAEGASLVIGKKQFIPGFEEGVVGMKAGDQKIVTATFPEDYPMKNLAGKAAEFDVSVTAVAKPKKPDIDEDFAKGLGAEDLKTLRGFVTDQIKREYSQASRVKLKREILDALDKAHTFELPASLVEFEFNNIWTQLESNLKAANKTIADEGKSEEELRAEYRGIAERRVRLGLVIGEIGEKNKLQVSQDELRRALVEQARRYPGREKQVYEFYEKTPGALNELRAPIFEDKVIDYVIAEAKPIEKKVSRDELLKAVEEATGAEA